MLAGSGAAGDFGNDAIGEALRSGAVAARKAVVASIAGCIGTVDRSVSARAAANIPHGHRHTVGIDGTARVVVRQTDGRTATAGQTQRSGPNQRGTEKGQGSEVHGGHCTLFNCSEKLNNLATIRYIVLSVFAPELRTLAVGLFPIQIRVIDRRQRRPLCLSLGNPFVDFAQE